MSNRKTKAEIQRWINEAIERVKGCKSADEYVYGFREGAEALLDHLVEEDVIGF